MCTSAWNLETNKEISCIGDLRAISPIVFRSSSWSEEDFDNLPDDACLCPVDVAGTLVFAGYRVWANPDMIPEYLFDNPPKPIPNPMTEGE